MFIKTKVDKENAILYPWADTERFNFTCSLTMQSYTFGPIRYGTNQHTYFNSCCNLSYADSRPFFGQLLMQSNNGAVLNENILEQG